MNQRQRRGVSLATLLATMGGVGLLLMTMALGAGASVNTAINIGSGTTTMGGLQHDRLGDHRPQRLHLQQGLISRFRSIRLGFDRPRSIPRRAFAGWSLIPAPED
ncbi:hypothetical protein [Candidatus Amarobacter glycogenicus]|uniref:hypothetical protein n=1 Tax=Candidatus Amarobacter glycogenicus TaxID=3140699 RepID=UPI003136ECC1|nr:hypothetical protein [Dehalococcoidia bacterium]